MGADLDKAGCETFLTHIFYSFPLPFRYTILCFFTLPALVRQNLFFCLSFLVYGIHCDVNKLCSFTVKTRGLWSSICWCGLKFTKCHQLESKFVYLRVLLKLARHLTEWPVGCVFDSLQSVSGDTDPVSNPWCSLEKFDLNSDWFASAIIRLVRVSPINCRLF